MQRRRSGGGRSRFTLVNIFGNTLKREGGAATGAHTSGRVGAAGGEAALLQQRDRSERRKQLDGKADQVAARCTCRNIHVSERCVTTSCMTERNTLACNSIRLDRPPPLPNTLRMCSHPNENDMALNMPRKLPGGISHRKCKTPTEFVVKHIQKLTL